MAGLFFVYALSGISGIVIERRLVLNSLLKRSILVSAAAAAQIVFCVQVLSLGKQLSGVGLVLANLALTAAAVGVLGLRTLPPPIRISWRALFSRSLSELSSSSKDPTVLALSGVALVMFFTACVAGWCMIPFGDCYHLEMPLFWMQNHSILPFPVPNPRIVSLSFLSEALQLPGFLYVRSPVMAVIFTFLPGLLALGAVFSLARRIGADCKASICAAAITAGYTRFALDPLYAAGEGFWAAAWFGGSLIFSLRCSSSRFRRLPLASRYSLFGLLLYDGLRSQELDCFANPTLFDRFLFYPSRKACETNFSFAFGCHYGYAHAGEKSLFGFYSADWGVESNLLDPPWVRNGWLALLWGHLELCLKHCLVR